MVFISRKRSSDEEKAYNRGFMAGFEKGIEISKRTFADQDYLDFEDGKITMNEYRQRKGLQPIKNSKLESLKKGTQS